MAPDSLRLPAVLQSLERFQAFVTEKAEEVDISPVLALKLELILEELLVNVASYAYPDGQGEVEVVVDAAPGRDLILSIRDWGTPFDPTQQADPDITLDVESRGIGGLGIHFVRETAKSVAYARQDDANVLTITFDPAGKP